MLTIAAAAVLAAAAAQPAHTASRSAPLVVAVVDSGVDASAPGLRARLVAGADLATGTAATQDAVGHGTAVASVIAAACHACRVMPVRVIGPSGTTTPAMLAAGIRWAAEHGARVINLSLAMPSPDAAVAAAVAEATAAGDAVVAGAGNDGVAARVWPAASDGVLSVGGATAAGMREPWSNYGAWVDIAAPGCIVTHGLRGVLVQFCGTSSAAARVSGFVARALASHPAADAAAVIAAVERSADSVGPFVRYGRIDAGAALAALRPVPAN